MPDRSLVDRREFARYCVVPVVALAGCGRATNDDERTTAGPSNRKVTTTVDRPNGEVTTTIARPNGEVTTTVDRPNGEVTTARGSTVAGQSTTMQSTTTTGGPPDLREANVVGVAFDGSDGSVDFDVTLYHDDDGEDGYADWWQVETLDGERLGRRDLTHSHSTDPFTRSGTYEIPADVTCVVVRGHDQTHDYGGRATLVNLDSGATRAVDQGSEPNGFSASDCPS